MLRACSPCASDAAAFGGGRACPGGPACVEGGVQTSADDACSGDASSSRSQPTSQTKYSPTAVKQTSHLYRFNFVYHVLFLP